MFWRWQHRLLIDAVRQFGYPSIFVTISPFEWSFPWPPWIEQLRALTGLGPTRLAAVETVHIAHVLEQVVRGYLCGSNTNRWQQHVFNNCARPVQTNIRTYFYRFEFQQRGIVHLHLLVWLDDIQEIRHELVQGSIPWTNCRDAFQVASKQSSDKGAMVVNHEPSQFIQAEDDETTLLLHHSEDDFRRNLRAYITTLLGSLHCRTDIQCTDGPGMLLKYVSSYESKWEEHATNESLYVSDITGFEAANSFLRCMKPLEPEMVLQLSNIKIAWSNSRTKRFVAPTPEKTKTNTTYQKYLKRPDEEAETTFLQWLREYNESQRKPKKYTSGTTLVGVQQFSVFNPVFFFQHLLMNHPHTSEEQIHHSEEQQLPASVKYFRKATELLPELWMSQDAINSYFATESHKSHYINTISYYINSLHDIMRLWSIQVIPHDIVDIQTTSTETLFP